MTLQPAHIPQTAEKMVTTEACEAFNMPYNTGEQWHFPPCGLIERGVKSKTPFGVMVLLQEPDTANLAFISHAFLYLPTWLMKWCYSRSHLPDSSNWATNTSLFTYLYKYRHVYIYVHICKVMLARWKSLPALMSCCSSRELFTDLCVTGIAAWLPASVDQFPQLMLTRSPRPCGV